MDKCREAFEKWYKRAFGGNPLKIHGAARWNAWKAAWNAKPPEPWDMVISNMKILSNATEIRLSVEKSGQWEINELIDMGIHYMKHKVATGYNCDPSRNGETKTWNEEEKRWVVK